MDLLQSAAELICRHIAPEDRGAIWDRVRRRAARCPINRSFLWTVERRHRIDEWRSRTRARVSSRRVAFTSFQDPESFVPDADVLSCRIDEVECYPPNLLQSLLAGMTPRETAIVWTVIVDGIPQAEVGRVLGLTESRMSQLLRLVRAKINANLRMTWPTLEAEFR